MAKSLKIDRLGAVFAERTDEQPMRKEPSADFGKKFTFDDDSEEIESISAGSALGMAVVKAIGIPECIDNKPNGTISTRVEPRKRIESDMRHNVHGESETFSDGNIVILRIFACRYVVRRKGRSPIFERRIPGKGHGHNIRRQS